MVVGVCALAWYRASQGLAAARTDSGDDMSSRVSRIFLAVAEV